MPTEKEALECKKAMAYDLLTVIGAAKDKDTYTKEEIKEIIDAYIAGLK